MVLVFKDGHTETIPISKIHIDVSGETTTLPENTYPIVANPHGVYMSTDSYGWGSAGASFGTADDSASLYGVSYNDNTDQAGTNGSGNRFYLPLCVNTLENLQNGYPQYYNNKGSVPSGWEAIYVYAEK